MVSLTNIGNVSFSLKGIPLPTDGDGEDDNDDLLAVKKAVLGNRNRRRIMMICSTKLYGTQFWTREITPLHTSLTLTK